MLPKSAHNSPAGARRRSRPSAAPRGRRRRPRSARRRANCSNARRSMLVIRLPKRSTRTTSPVDSVARSTDGRGRSSVLEVVDASCPSDDQRDALGQPAGRRRESIAAFERAADGGPRVLALGELDDPLRRRLAEHRRQHAVVGRDEPVVAGLGGDAAARRADAGIDDDEEDRAGRKVAIARGELERAGEHVVRRECRG